MRYTTSAAAVAALATVASAKNWKVEVGDDSKDAFSPTSLSGVAKGDTISFKIYNTHNVIQGDFSSPCEASSSGFDSGKPYSGGKSNPEFFVVTVNDTDPIYAYCGFPGHCQQGMVFAVNAPDSGNTFDKYQAAAEKSSSSSGGDAIAGGVYSSSEGGSSSGGSSASASASSSASAAASSSKSAASESSSSSSTASSGGSSSVTTSASTTTSGTPSSTSAAPASTSSPGGAAGLQPGQGFATGAVLGLAGLLSWFL